MELIIDGSEEQAAKILNISVSELKERMSIKLPERDTVNRMLVKGIWNTIVNIKKDFPNRLPRVQEYLESVLEAVKQWQDTSEEV